MTDEARLVAAARAGPGGSGFAAIYQRYGDRIHDYCLAVLRHREDAADAAQDTFLIAYQRLGQLRDPAKLTAWLFAIARSRCLRRIAERQRQRPTEDLEQLSPPQAAPAGEVERAEMRRMVWDAAAGLAADDRAVLDLHLRQGLSGAELADALGVPAEKANLMLHRMKQRMGRTIGALLVVRTGRRDCPDLAAIAAGELTPLIRKRLARHIERCQVCLARRDRLAPELVYASVPLVPAPLVLGERLTALTASGAADAIMSDEPRWDADGFPHPVGFRAPLPVRHRIAVGAGVVALVGLGLLGGYATGRIMADDTSSSVDGFAAASVNPTVTPAPAGPTNRSAPPALVPPPAVSPPPPSGGPSASPVEPSSPAPSTPLDVTPPTMSPLRLGDCGLTVTAEVDVTDAIDPQPTAVLMLSWDVGPGSPVPMTHVGEGTYRAVVDRDGAAKGFVIFTALGTVADASGNTALRQATAHCTPIVD